jgi:hypothetical protein
MACLDVGRAVHHERRHDLTPDSCKGLTFDLFRASAIRGRTRNCEVFMHQSAGALGTHLSAITSAPTSTAQLDDSDGIRDKFDYV